MKQDNPKKPSLFKQKIKEARKHEVRQKEKGFPTAINILSQVYQKPQQKEDSIPQQPGNPFIKKIKSHSKLNEEELGNIQKQNWKIIEDMSETERQQNMKKLSLQLPKGFLEKLKIKKQTKNTEEKHKQKVKQQKRQTKEQEKGQQQAFQGQPLLQMLFFNLEKNDITIQQKNTQEKKNFISIKQISEMIGSENNQSQIVGSKIYLTIVKKLTQRTTKLTLELVKIDGIPFHIKMLLQQLWQRLMVLLIDRLRKTTFKSVFLELSTNFIEIVTNSYNLLSTKYAQNVTKYSEQIQKKFCTFDFDKQHKKIFTESLKTMHNNTIQDVQKNRNHYCWQMEQQSLDYLCEIIILEQSPGNNYKFLKIVDQLLGQIINANIKEQENQLLQFLYGLFRKLSKSPYIPIVKGIKACLSKPVTLLLENILSQLNLTSESKLQMMHRMLYIIQFFNNMDAFNNFIKEISTRKIHGSYLQLILYFTLGEYSKDIDNSEVQKLNQFISWIKKVTSEGFLKGQKLYVFQDLMVIFQSQSQVYNLMDNSILDELFKVLCQKIKSTQKPQFSEYQIKDLIKSYNYNSFGNKIFTKIILFISVYSEQSIQCLILEQLVQKYPFIFYYSFEQMPEVYGNKNLYQFNQRNSTIKKQIKEMVAEKYTKNNSNAFLLFLGD